MKTMKKYAFLVAAAAMGFTACSKEEAAGFGTDPAFTLSIEASADETRSSFGELVDNRYLSTWSGTEEVYFYLGEDQDGIKASPSGAGSSATFDVTSDTAPESGTIIYALSPAGDYGSTPKKGGFTSDRLNYRDSYSSVVIPAEQTPLAGSCDESVHLLAAAQAFTGDIESPLKMHFRHAAAYGRMEIAGFTGKIRSVVVDSPVAIAGDDCLYHYKTGELNGADGTTLVLNADNVVDNVFWFGCAPANLNSGEMTVTVIDDVGKRYIKTIPLSADKYIDLIQGSIASFRVNMAGIEAEPYIIADLSTAEITSQFNVQRYDDRQTSYTDTRDGVVWSFIGQKVSATDPFLQIRSSSMSHVAIDANGANIREITVHITKDNNNPYNKTLWVKASYAGTSDNVATGTDDDHDGMITVTIDGDYSNLYLMSSNGQAKIHSVEVKLSREE